MNNRIKLVRESLINEKGKKYTQTDLANAMHVTRDIIATYEVGRVEPTPLFISTLCEKFNVNEEWLRTGSGEMFIEKTKHESITDFFAEVLNDDPDTFRFRLINALAELPLSDWEMLANLCERIVKDKENKE